MDRKCQRHHRHCEDMMATGISLCPVRPCPSDPRMAACLLTKKKRNNRDNNIYAGYLILFNFKTLFLSTNSPPTVFVKLLHKMLSLNSAHERCAGALGGAKFRSSYVRHARICLNQCFTYADYVAVLFAFFIRITVSVLFYISTAEHKSCLFTFTFTIPYLHSYTYHFCWLLCHLCNCFL